ncbi:MAG: uroporphyrinogen-III synthase [Prevotellaceae bacterium]|jgi:uroporphyrinogen-III synthase|nr:uroporphyrinogen-III synthase [Prevotellaceae bacterium]
MKVKKMLVSQPKPTSEKSPYFDIAKKFGVKIDFRQFIKIEPVSVKDFRQQKINILDFTAIIFTARHGVEHFFRMCEEMRITVPDTMKYFCTTDAIAYSLQKYITYRKRKIFYGKENKLDELIALIQKHSTEKFLMVVSDVHTKENIIGLMDKQGIQYSKAVMYRTVSNDFTPEEEFNYDMLVFFSPSGIASLGKNFPEFVQGDIQIACFGQNTIQAARDAGLRVDVEAPRPDAPSMTAAIEIRLKELQKATKK